MFRSLTAGAIALSVAVVLVLASFAGILWAFARQDAGRELVQHTLEVETRLHQMLSRLDDAETGQRGYLLTGEEPYLAPYLAAVAAIDGELQTLAELTSDRPAQQQALSTLRRDTTERLAILQRGIDFRRGGEGDKALALIRGGTGKVLMDRMRETLARMIATEDRLLQTRREALDQTSLALLLGIVIAFAAAVALGGFALWNEQRQRLRLAASRDALVLANESLVREATERGQVEHQLRQSQKMEAIGELTGGIAHDFNNILLVIMANVELLAEGRDIEPEASRHMDRIISSTVRAADLTKQLLAFARKQPLRPQSTSLNEIVAATGKMMKRTLGASIEVESILAADLWLTNVDRAQLESSLVNLCLNARDAMPGGGRLLIETQNIELDEDYVKLEPDAVAGEYAMLAVTDTGTGIPADILEHVFEPFVTTKEVGKGTGLGLSMVYGFIKQSNGHIKIYSEIGHGTTMRIYLPRNHQAASEVEAAVMSVPRGAERILVVEDDNFVRESVVLQLRGLGYATGEADCAAAGLERLRRDPAYALLLTDVVMPGMNGKVFADEAQRNDPRLRVLFMSGYTENAIFRNGHLATGIRLLSKPFRKVDLAQAVRHAIDGTAVAVVA